MLNVSHVHITAIDGEEYFYVNHDANHSISIKVSSKMICTTAIDEIAAKQKINCPQFGTPPTFKNFLRSPIGKQYTKLAAKLIDKKESDLIQINRSEIIGIQGIWGHHSLVSTYVDYLEISSITKCVGLLLVTLQPKSMNGCVMKTSEIKQLKQHFSEFNKLVDECQLMIKKSSKILSKVSSEIDFFQPLCCAADAHHLQYFSLRMKYKLEELANEEKKEFPQLQLEMVHE